MIVLAAPLRVELLPVRDGDSGSITGWAVVLEREHVLDAADARIVATALLQGADGAEQRTTKEDLEMTSGNGETCWGCQKAAAAVTLEITLRSAPAPDEEIHESFTLCLDCVPAWVDYNGHFPAALEARRLLVEQQQQQAESAKSDDG